MRRGTGVSAPWAIGLVGHVSLWLAGRELRGPAGASLGELEAWYRTAEPGEAAAAVAWVAGVAISGWLAVALALQVLTAIPGGACIRPVADLISPRSLQRLGRSLARLSLTAGLAAAAPSAGPDALVPGEPPPVIDATTAPADPDPPGTATMSRLEDPEASPVPSVVPPSTSSVPATPTSVDPEGRDADGAGDGLPPAAAPGGPPPTPDVTVRSGPASEPPAAPPSVDARTLSPAPPAIPVRGQPSPALDRDQPSETVMVEPGMSFWSIATEALVDAGHPSDDASVGRYWRRVIDANRDRLVVPANPDLLLPGQVLVLPPR